MKVCYDETAPPLRLKCPADKPYCSNGYCGTVNSCQLKPNIDANVQSFRCTSDGIFPGKTPVFEKKKKFDPINNKLFDNSIQIQPTAQIGTNVSDLLLRKSHVVLDIFSTQKLIYAFEVHLE